MTKLQELPARMDALSTRIAQLREEMYGGCSNLREEVRAGDDRVMAHARELHEALKEQIHAGDERVMNHVRVLYEDLKADLKLIKEGQSASPRRRTKG